jgi:phosphate transport system substrate-binding protein
MKRRQLLSALAFMPTTAWASTLPPPSHGSVGRVRLAGTASMAPVVAAWKLAFQAAYPTVKIDAAMAGSDVAMANLYTAVCDIALIGREATKPEIQAFEWIYRFRPQGVAVLNGSVATPGSSPAVAAMVHRSNPVKALSVSQLRVAFGDSGPHARTWGDLGLEGEWRDRLINLYAPVAESGTGRFFRAAVLGGSNRMAWSRMREFAVAPLPAGAETDGAVALRRALAHDPAGLAVGAAGTEVKVLPLSSANNMPRMPSADTIVSGSYPLGRTVQAYYAVPSKSSIHPETLAFLQFILSPGAQAIAARSSDYLALSAGAAQQARTALT